MAVLQRHSLSASQKWVLHSVIVCWRASLALHSLLTMEKRPFSSTIGACADGVGDGDGISTFGGKLHAGLKLSEEIIDGRGRGFRCAHASCVGGKVFVVNLSVRQP